MIKLFSFIFAFFSIISYQAFAESPRFISGFEDIPLMDGLKQAESENFSFGNEETRYIEVQLIATQTISFNEIKTFYMETLTQFGWKAINNTSKQLSLARESDILEINQTTSSPLKISIILKNKI